MPKKEKVLRIFLGDTNTELLSAILRNLEIYIEYANFERVLLYTASLDDIIVNYSIGHSFFSYKVVDKKHLEKQCRKSVLTPSREILNICANSDYSNDVLNLIGENDISIDEIVLIGLFGIPETCLPQYYVIGSST